MSFMPLSYKVIREVLKIYLSVDGRAKRILATSGDVSLLEIWGFIFKMRTSTCRLRVVPQHKYLMLSVLMNDSFRGALVQFRLRYKGSCQGPQRRNLSYFPRAYYASQHLADPTLRSLVYLY